jgi:hypothetical protein
LPAQLCFASFSPPVPLIPSRDLCGSLSSVILNGAKRSEESRISFYYEILRSLRSLRMTNYKNSRRSPKSPANDNFSLGADPGVRPQAGAPTGAPLPFRALPWPLGMRSHRTLREPATIPLVPKLLLGNALGRQAPAWRKSGGPELCRALGQAGAWEPVQPVSRLGSRRLIPSCSQKGIKCRGEPCVRPVAPGRTQGSLRKISL